MSQDENTAQTNQSVTHWKKLTNPNYIGAHDFQPNQELTITIESVGNEMVKNMDGKDESCIVARINKKASNTKTAFDKFILEVEKIQKVPINEIMELIVAKSWAGFKAEWFNNENNNTNGKQFTTKGGEKQHPLTELRAAANQILANYSSQNDRASD